MGSGGGGSSTTTSSGIDPEFKPYLKDVLSDVTTRYKADVAAGPDAIVAGLDPRQAAAINAQTDLAQQMISGSGIYDTEAQARRLLANERGKMAQSLYGSGESVGGSARQQRAIESAMADKAMDLARERQRVADLGVKNLGMAGTTLQQQQQRRLDAPHTSAQRYFGYLGSAPQQQTSTSSGGK
jgi:hypothetical protein